MKHFIRRTILWALFANTVITSDSFGETSPDWRPVIVQNQSALVILKSKKQVDSLGVFVSKDGHALASLKFFLGEELPAVALMQDDSHAVIDSIVAVFPDQDLVLLKLKLKGRPKKWLTITEQPLALGAATAFLVPGQDSPAHAGPVLARRATRHGPKIGLPFATVLSIGTRKPTQTPDAVSSLPTGSPLIDPLGKVCGVFNSFQVSEGQVLVEAVPLDLIAQALNTAIAGSGTIPFPIPKKLNPYSEVLQNPEFSKATNAHRAGDTVQALNHIEALLKALPTDPVVRELQIDVLTSGGREAEAEQLIASLSRPDSLVKFDQLSLLGHRRRIFMNKRQWDEAITTSLEAVERSPLDYPAAAFILAQCYARRGEQTDNREDYLAAEKWYKTALQSGSDHIVIFTSYKSVLARLLRWEDYDAATEAIKKLEKLYR